MTFENDGGAGFDKRQAERKIFLERLALAGQVIGVTYIAVHIGVTWQAFKIDGWLNAFITFVTLGFGDLYWALRWFSEGRDDWSAPIALGAALLCFISWGTRPLVNQMLNSFTIEMLKDSGKEFDRIAREAEEFARQRREQGIEDDYIDLPDEDTYQPGDGSDRHLPVSPDKPDKH